MVDVYRVGEKGEKTRGKMNDVSNSVIYGAKLKEKWMREPDARKKRSSISGEGKKIYWKQGRENARKKEAKV